MGDDGALLEKYKPVLRYDSNEGYFADDAAEMTDAVGNCLIAGGQEIAQSGADLNLDFLVAAGQKYPGTDVVASAGDVLSIPDKKYQERYRVVRTAGDYSNVVYGHRKGDWLQYWCWYFYNPERALDIGLGLHEGDWEGIQLRLGANDEPDLAVYAQHDYGEALAWEHVKKVGNRPVVYVALGSHASYFTDGGWPLHWHRTEHFLDRTDGKVTPKGDVRVVVLEDDSPSWVRWPGRWGDTKKPPPEPGPISEAYAAISGDSPVGPGINPRWDNPQHLLDSAVKAHRAPGVPPATPSELHAQVTDGRLQVDYKVDPKAGEEQPTHLLVTVNSPHDPFPPTTYKVALPDPAAGTVEVPLDVDPAHHYDLNVSAATEDGRLSPSVPVAAPPTP